MEIPTVEGLTSRYLLFWDKSGNTYYGFYHSNGNFYVEGRTVISGVVDWKYLSDFDRMTPFKALDIVAEYIEPGDEIGNEALSVLAKFISDEG